MSLKPPCESQRQEFALRSNVRAVCQIPGKARPRRWSAAIWCRLGCSPQRRRQPHQHHCFTTRPGPDLDLARQHLEAVRKLFQILNTQGGTVYIFLIADVNLCTNACFSQAPLPLPPSPPFLSVLNVASLSPAGFPLQVRLKFRQYLK